MMIGRLCHASINLASVVRLNSRLGVGSLIDGGQNIVWLLALEDGTPQNYENRSKYLVYI